MMPVNDVKESMGLVVSEFRMRVGRELGERVSQQRFSELLCAGVRDEPYSRSTIAMWESDEAPVETDFLIDLLMYHFDDAGAWQFGFAVGCLHIKFPDFFRAVRGQ